MATKITEHRWDYCSVCEVWMVICGTCGNNCCNGSYGKLPDGSECPDCKSAYKMQEEGWKGHND